jgi:pimeloyl-ACP methyl ester carboxylesterase
MSRDSDPNRRRFLRTVALTLAAAAQLDRMGKADAQPGKPTPAAVPPITPGTHTSLGPLTQIDAGVLNVGLAETGPSAGPAVMLLHGWPYDIHTYVDVAPLLGSAGYRVIVPFLRGYGTTRFLSADTFRNGQPSALAVDIIALMDTLKIEKAIVAGCDWGARTADIMAALWPERCKALVSVSGYLISNRRPASRRCRQGPSSNGGINSTLPLNAAGPVTTSTGVTLRSSSGSSPRRNGPSMTPRSTAARPPSTTRTTSPS